MKMWKRFVSFICAFAALASTNSLGAQGVEDVFHPDRNLPLTSLKWQRQQIRKMIKAYVRKAGPENSETGKAVNLYKEVKENYNRLIDQMGTQIETGKEADLAGLSEEVAKQALDLELFLKEKTKGRIKKICWENCRFMLDAAKLNDVGRALVAKYKTLPDEDVRAEEVQEEVLTLKLPDEMGQLL